ncbi:hypothetical protein E5676_scaffold16G001100 [Cucumis melo var. makuwa]|uniref:Uncharacterized protein n=1 Tax=Cucumis melo var. makuwa TaxID=1194695 RepID=A0A5D3CF62_CUCMM|nr:hypothetical protein E5676_scaffold16G001100 [Cucumis melo var. makuwa]
MRDLQIIAKRNRVKSVSKIYLHRALESPPIFDIYNQLELRVTEDSRGGAPFFLDRKKITTIKPLNCFSNPNLEIPTIK